MLQNQPLPPLPTLRLASVAVAPFCHLDQNLLFYVIRNEQAEGRILVKLIGLHLLHQAINEGGGEMVLIVFSEEVFNLWDDVLCICFKLCPSLK